MANKDLFGNDIIENVLLRERYGEVPVSILNTTTGHWINRKRNWMKLNFESEVGREKNLLGFSKTCATIQGGKESHKGISVFDPVLTELMYNWFCPENGTILDPFAGGSVRGIVANYRKLKRWGKTCVLMSIGVDNGKYVDLIFGNKKKYPFGYYWIVEGVGTKKENFGSSFVEVESFNCSNFQESKDFQFSEWFY